MKKYGFRKKGFSHYATLTFILLAFFCVMLGCAKARPTAAVQQQAPQSAAATTSPEQGPASSADFGISPSGVTTPSPPPSATQEASTALSGFAIVMADSLNMRQEPHVGAQVVGGLIEGDRVKTLEAQGDWLYVQAGNVLGYVKAEFVSLSDGSIAPVSAPVFFYDAEKGEFVTCDKSFYWARYGGKNRRFDARLSPEDFDLKENGQIAVSQSIVSLTQNMAYALYQSQTVSINCYYGQYYPSETDESGRVYETGIHEGIDFGGPALDAPFYSLTEGVVTSLQRADNNKDYAWVGIKTGGYTVFYVHGLEYYVQVGESVQKGQLIGKQGDLGAPGAYHVHLSLSKGDTATFARSKDTELESEPPYLFWKEMGY